MDAFMEGALEECKKGGDPETGAVLALLAIAQAIGTLAEATNNLSDEIRGMGTELHPINTWEQNR